MAGPRPIWCNTVSLLTAKKMEITKQKLSVGESNPAFARDKRVY